MPPLRNPRHEKFCQRYVELGNASEAYRRAGYHSDPCNGNSARLIATDSIKQRITELKARALFKVELEKRELAGFYGAVVTTPAGEVSKDSPLCQSYEESPKGIKLRMPDKVAAAQALARLAGYDVQRVEVTIDPLSAYLRELRMTKPDTHAMTDRYDNEPNMPNPLTINEGVSLRDNDTH